MAMTIAQLRALTATVEHGSFTLGAASLGLSQSAVSHAVAGLERELGNPVLQRGATAVPTALGDVVLAHARTVLASVDALETAVRPTTMRGVVRLAAVPTVCQGLLPRLMELWKAVMPEVTVHVYEGDDDEMPEWLERGTVDAAVLVDPDPMPEGGVVVARDEMAAVIRKDHPLARMPMLTLEDLHDDGLVVGGGGCERQVQRLHELDGRPYQYDHCVREMSTVFGMVDRGDGVAIVPTLGQAMLPDTLMMRPLAVRLERSLVLAGPDDRAWTPLVTALVSTASEGEPVVVS